MPGIPIRLSEQLAERARTAANVQERSLREQVEHWARLGELVEATVSHASVERLKTVSHDDDLRARLAAADTAKGRRKAAQLIESSGGPWYGADPDDPRGVIRYDPDGSEIRGRMVRGRFRPKTAR